MVLLRKNRHVPVDTLCGTHGLSCHEFGIVDVHTNNVPITEVKLVSWENHIK